jgi:hypothetical protein
VKSCVGEIIGEEVIKTEEAFQQDILRQTPKRP